MLMRHEETKGKKEKEKIAVRCRCETATSRGRATTSGSSLLCNFYAARNDNRVVDAIQENVGFVEGNLYPGRKSHISTVHSAYSAYSAETCLVALHHQPAIAGRLHQMWHVRHCECRLDRPNQLQSKSLADEDGRGQTEPTSLLTVPCFAH